MATMLRDKLCDIQWRMGMTEEWPHGFSHSVYMHIAAGVPFEVYGITKDEIEAMRELANVCEGWWDWDATTSRPRFHHLGVWEAMVWSRLTGPQEQVDG